VTHAQHCRAEVFLTGFGWVPVDPADVRKVVLEEPPGHLALDNALVTDARTTLFGAWESNWVAYNDGHDVRLPGSSHRELGSSCIRRPKPAANVSIASPPTTSATPLPHTK